MRGLQCSVGFFYFCSKPLIKDVILKCSCLLLSVSLEKQIEHKLIASNKHRVDISLSICFYLLVYVFIPPGLVGNCCTLQVDDFDV